jgi:hypothetical protein
LQAGKTIGRLVAVREAMAHVLAEVNNELEWAEGIIDQKEMEVEVLAEELSAIQRQLKEQREIRQGWIEELKKMMEETRRLISDTDEPVLEQPRVSGTDKELEKSAMMERPRNHFVVDKLGRETEFCLQQLYGKCRRFAEGEEVRCKGGAHFEGGRCPFGCGKLVSRKAWLTFMSM